MSAIDSIVLANLRNRIGKRNLHKELEKLEKAHQSEMRMLQTSRQRFRAKFLKADRVVPSMGSEASNVRMYETHNPGFCYHRNGEYRVFGLCPKSSPSQIFQMMLTLLFTNGEVDIEKVVCLHLLAAHTSQYDRNGTSEYSRGTTSSCSGHSRSPPPYRRPQFYQKAISCMTRDRAVHPGGTVDDVKIGMSRMLPRYIIDLTRPDYDISDGDDGGETSTPVDDSDSDEDTDEKVSLFINTQVEALIDSVMEALKDANPTKIKDMLLLLRDPALLRNMLAKSDIQIFLDSLRGKEILMRGSHFRCSPANVVNRSFIDDPSIKPKMKKKCYLPVKKDDKKIIAINLKIPNSSHSLEKLVEEIRRNVLLQAMRLSNFVTDLRGGVVETEIGTSLYQMHSDMSINDSRLALAGSITGPFASKMSLDPLGSMYTLGSNLDSKITIPSNTNLKMASNLSIPQQPESTKIYDEELNDDLDSQKFAVRKLPRSADADRWNLRQKYNEHTSTSKGGYVKGTIAHSTVVNKVAMKKLSKVKEMEQKVIDNFIESLTDSFALQDKYDEAIALEAEKLHLYPLMNYIKQAILKPKSKAMKIEEQNNTVSKILRRMNNSQRILVGMRTARIKSHQVNVEGIEPTAKYPLVELVAPVLSKTSIIALTTPSQENIRQMMLAAPTTMGASSVTMLKNGGHSHKSSSTLKGIPLPNLELTNEESERKLYRAGTDTSDSGSKLTKANLVKLKLVISEKETEKKVAMFLQKPNP